MGEGSPQSPVFTTQARFFLSCAALPPYRRCTHTAAGGRPPFSTPDHVTMLIKPSTTFDQKRFKCFFTHSVECSCGQKRASLECCGLCGSLLVLLGFHGVAMVNRHCQRSASVKMWILVYVEAVPRFQADTWILPHFQLKEQENLVLVDLQKHYQLEKGIKWIKISCSLRRICCQNELDL